MKKVSVIVPMYKAKAYIRPCVEALLRQRLGNDFEILLIDDKSPDDTYEYACELYKDNPCVRVIRQEVNGGPGKARNRGLMDATGKYICFADVDDMYLDNAISDMLAVAQKENADVVHTTGVRFTVVKPLPDDLSTLTEDDYVNLVFSKTTGDVFNTASYSIDDMEERILAWHEQKIHWSVWGKLYRKDFLKDNNIQFSNMKIGEDCLFVMKCVLMAKKYVQNNTFTYIYRIGESQSVSRGAKNPKVFINAQMSLFEIERHFDEEFSSIPYLKENPQELPKLKEMEITNIKGPYAIAKFKEIGRATLEEDEGVISLFEDYFGDASKDKMKEIFDEYESSTETRNADRFSSYEMWKFVKDKVSRDVISLESLVKVLS